MKCSAVVKIEGSKEVMQSFAPEDKKIGNRANYSIKRKGKELIFKIKAEDAVSLRAAFNSITKMLAVIEKVREVE